MTQKGAGTYEDTLAPFSSLSSTTLGREHKEKEHPYRSPYQRDRDRVIHSAAFRRLESKTQVYTHLYLQGDLFRKRLTHTLEVAQIARSIARELRINEDLTEAIALAHDLGHPPFGHKGEDILHGMMKNAGGFEHNTQALRIICVIERKYPDFSGLNLTYEVREAIAKKGKERQAEPLKDKFESFKNPTLEAQAVDIADPITYTTHDLDDGITAGTITRETLEDCEFWKDGEKHVLKIHPGLDKRFKVLKSQVVRYIINEQVTDLINTTRERIDESGPKSVDDVRNLSVKLCGFSERMQKKHANLKNFLFKNMYENYQVKRMEDKARKVIEELFNAFLGSPDLFPESVLKHFKEQKKKGNEKRIVCDYIAGMTDRFAIDEYKKMFDPTATV